MSTCLMHLNLSTAKHLENFHDFFNTSPTVFLQRHRGSLVCTLNICKKIDFNFDFDRHRCHMAAKFGLFVDEDHSKLPTLYWLPKLH